MFLRTFRSISELVAFIPQPPLRMRVATDKNVKAHMTVMFQAAYNREHCLEFNIFACGLRYIFLILLAVGSRCLFWGLTAENVFWTLHWSLQVPEFVKKVAFLCLSKVLFKVGPRALCQVASTIFKKMPANYPMNSWSFTTPFCRLKHVSSRCTVAQVWKKCSVGCFKSALVAPFSTAWGAIWHR